jgi:type IV pilus assembly protein PilA
MRSWKVNQQGEAMFCSKCGDALLENNQFCSRCGAPTTAESNPTAAPAALPIETGETSGKAIGSLITGVCGLLLFPAAIAAIILGHISRSEIRKSNGRLQGAGMAITGLIFGYLVIAFIPILIIAAIAIPNLLRARIAANESSAVASVRTLNTAQVSYNSAYPKVGFAASLSNLSGTSCSPPSSTGACLIDTVLASGTKHGYVFALSGVTGTPASTYQFVASPIVPKQTGVRYFCSLEDGVVRYSSATISTCDATVDPLQ